MADDDLTSELDRIAAIGAATEHLEGTCWLCRGLGGIAVHLKWSAERGEGRLPLWTAHEYPSDDSHPVEPCPACALTSSVAALRAVLEFHAETRHGCSSCLDAYGDRVDWPCPEYEAISTALTGKEGSGDEH